MRKPAQKMLLLAVGIVVATTLIIGCEAENLSDTKSNTAKSKLVAAENRQLRKEIKDLKKQHKKELKQQEGLLTKCQQEKDALVKLSGEGIRDLMDSALNDITEEVARLREVNENLKSQVEELQRENDNLKRLITQLKKELEELRKRPMIPDKPQPL